MMRVRVSVDNDAALRQLDATLRRLANLRPALDILAGITQEASKTQFETGKGWAPLAKSTVAEKGNNRKLIDSGKLRDAFTKRPDIRYDRFGVRVGVSSRTHPEAFHLKFGDRGMKKRNPAKVDTKWVKQEAAKRLLEHFVSGGFRGPTL